MVRAVVVAVAIVIAMVFPLLGAACTPDAGAADAGAGFRDDAGNINGTPGVDRVADTCDRVDFDLSQCAGDPDSCTADNQCGAGQRCFLHQPHCECRAACASDVDCAAGTACACDLDACVPADCRSGADCASGHCGVARSPGGCRETLAFKCRVGTDPCDSDDDCPAPAVGHAVCAPVDAGFACGNVSGDPCN